MTVAWFDPDTIRGDFESTFTSLYWPASYNATKNYALDERVRLGDRVYVATAPGAGVAPPGSQWQESGPACRIIYENVESTLGQFAAIRLALAWRDTKDETIYCPDGSLRSIKGTITFWVLTPKNQGTSTGLKIASSIRQSLALWKRIGTCGKEVRVSDVNGPRGGDAGQGSDHFLHIVTASLTTMEQVDYLR